MKYILVENKNASSLVEHLIIVRENALTIADGNTFWRMIANFCHCYNFFYKEESSADILTSLGTPDSSIRVLHSDKTLRSIRSLHFLKKKKKKKQQNKRKRNATNMLIFPYLCTDRRHFRAVPFCVKV